MNRIPWIKRVAFRIMRFGKKNYTGTSRRNTWLELVRILSTVPDSAIKVLDPGE
jgi:hypothetical protein